MISIVTPSTREDMLPIIERCLKRQDFRDFEWIITTPKNPKNFEPKEYTGNDILVLKDPPKKEGDFYTLCKGWNQAFAHAKGELVISLQDGIWFPPDTLSKFWFHYKRNPKSLVGAIGHQYEDFDEYGKPLNKVWHDPRAKNNTSFEDVPPSEIEFTLCSIPKEALNECGGIDEEYDTCPAVGEKEMCWRLNRMGWDFYLDQSLEYRAIHHPRLSGDWDKLYIERSTPLFTRHMTEMEGGVRTLNVESISKYVV